MFYYIDQPHDLSFPIGLVKTKSDFNVRSVETGLGRWTVVIAVISVDACPFSGFSDLTCHTGIQDLVFSGCTEPPDSKDNKLGCNNQETSPSAGKNTAINLVPCHA